MMFEFWTLWLNDARSESNFKIELILAVRLLHGDMPNNKKKPKDNNNKLDHKWQTQVTVDVWMIVEGLEEKNTLITVYRILWSLFHTKKSKWDVIYNRVVIEIK